MKILEISYSLTSGGAERFVVDLANELSKNEKNNVTLLTIVDDSTPQNKHYLPDLSNKIHYINAKSPSGLHIKSFFQVYKIIKKLKPDIVHAHGGILLLYIPALFLRHTSYIMTLHSVAHLCLNFKLQKYFDKFFFRNNKIYPVTISQDCHKSYENLYAINNDTNITNGRSKLPTTHKLKDVEKEINSYKQHKDDKIFIHVARCHPVKNQTLLFNVFNQLSKEYNQFQLLIIGSGYENNDIIKNINSKYIHILGEKNNIGDYLVFSNYFVLTSLFEGLPLSLLEAMSYGVIPISTPTSGIKNVIHNGENGFLSSSFNETDYLQTIKEAIAKEQNINKEKIKEEYEKYYSMSICADKYQQLYNKVNSTNLKNHI